VLHAAVVGPGVELGGVFELLTAAGVDGQERTAHVGERAHVAPELLELGDRVDVFLAVAPASLDVLDRYAIAASNDSGGGCSPAATIIRRRYTSPSRSSCDGDTVAPPVAERPTMSVASPENQPWDGAGMPRSSIKTEGRTPRIRATGVHKLFPRSSSLAVRDEKDQDRSLRIRPRRRDLVLWCKTAVRSGRAPTTSIDGMSRRQPLPLWPAEETDKGRSSAICWAHRDGARWHDQPLARGSGRKCLAPATACFLSLARRREGSFDGRHCIKITRKPVR